MHRNIYIYTYVCIYVYIYIRYSVMVLAPSSLTPDISLSDTERTCSMFPRARNLVEEASSAGKKRKFCSLSDDDEDPDILSKLMLTPAEPPPSLVLMVTDECSDEAAHVADEAVLMALAVSPGTFHQVKPDLNKRPVFRQEPMPGECNNKQLFIFYSSRGHESGTWQTSLSTQTSKSLRLLCTCLLLVMMSTIRRHTAHGGPGCQCQASSSCLGKSGCRNLLPRLWT